MMAMGTSLSSCSPRYMNDVCSRRLSFAWFCSASSSLHPGILAPIVETRDSSAALTELSTALCASALVMPSWSMRP